MWVDFLNSNAANFWRGLYKYDSFKGTSKTFSFWVDMNEPSVFSGEELTLPKNAYHMTETMDFVLHRDVHNAYGILTAKNSYLGIVERDED